MHFERTHQHALAEPAHAELLGKDSNMNNEHTDIPSDLVGTSTDTLVQPPKNPSDDNEDVPPLGEDDGRPHICVTLKQLPEAVAAARQALAARNNPPVLFEQG